MKVKVLAVLILSIALVITGFMLLDNIPRLNNIASSKQAPKDLSNAIDYIYKANPVSVAINSKISIQSEADAKLQQKKDIEAYEKELKERELKEKLERERKAKLNKGQEKVAYLTFDDGPSKIVTPAILDILDKYKIKATFFHVGKMVDIYPNITKEVYDRGHSLGNHSYSHDYAYLYRNNSNFMTDINKADEAFKRAIGDDFNTNLFRFPGGSFEKKKNPMKKAINEAGYTFYDWNTVNGDAEKSNPTVTYLFNRFTETYRGKKKIIVLMHDTDAKKANLEAVPMIIDRLIKEGYRFDTLDNYSN